MICYKSNRPKVVCLFAEAEEAAAYSDVGNNGCGTAVSVL